MRNRYAMRAPTPNNSTRQTAAYSLLELVFAIALVSGTLVPALALIRDSMELSETTDQHALLTNYAICKLEEQLAIAAAAWTSGVAEGDFAADGHSSIRFIVTRSDAVADGGLVGQLMHLEATCYVDEDSDDALDATEPQCHYRTKIGKFASYEAIASP